MAAGLTASKEETVANVSPHNRTHCGLYMTSRARSQGVRMPVSQSCHIVDRANGWVVAMIGVVKKKSYKCVHPIRSSAPRYRAMKEIWGIAPGIAEFNSQSIDPLVQSPAAPSEHEHARLELDPLASCSWIAAPTFVGRAGARYVCVTSRAESHLHSPTRWSVRAFGIVEWEELSPVLLPGYRHPRKVVGSPAVGGVRCSRRGATLCRE